MPLSPSRSLLRRLPDLLARRHRRPAPALQPPQLTLENLEPRCVLSSNPLLTELNLASVAEANETVTLTGAFVDADLGDTHTVRVNWGDGQTSEQTLTVGQREFSFDYEYDSASGLAGYRVQVEVTDLPSGQSPTLTAGGLMGSYFDGTTLTDLRFQQQSDVDFDWGVGSPNEPELGNDTFRVVWSGQVRPPQTGNYTFHEVSDDGVTLWVDGKLVTTQQLNQGPEQMSGRPVALNVGQTYEIRYEYTENAGGAVARLLWSGPGISGTQPVPVTTSTTDAGLSYFDGADRWSQTIHVTNDRPDLTLSGSVGSDASGASALTGETYSLQVTATDSDTSSAILTIDWGDGNQTVESFAYTSGSYTNTFTHQYETVGDYTVHAWLQDGNGVYGYEGLIRSQNPLAYYQFEDDTSGGVINDSIGTFNGINNGVGLGFASVSAGLGAAGDFAGNDWVELPNYQSLGLGGSFTLSTWYFADDLPVTPGGNYVDRSLLGADAVAGGGNSRFHFVLRDAEPHMGFYGNDLNTFPVVPPGTWNHVTYQFESTGTGGVQRVFHNGELLVTRNASSGLVGNAPALIGRWNNGNYFNGRIDEMAFFDSVLTAEQIQQQYETGLLDTAGLRVQVSNQPPELQNVTIVRNASNQRQVNLQGTIVDTDQPENLTLVIDWGDGNTQTVNNLTTYDFDIAHTYGSEAPADGWDVRVMVTDLANQSGTGFWGRYFDGTNFDTFEFARADANINFNWGGGAPNTSLLGNDDWSVVWEAELTIPTEANGGQTGLYQFIESTDDGARIYLNDQLISDQWFNQGAVPYTSTPVELTAGETYNLRVEFYEATSSASAVLTWLTPGQTDPALATAIPDSYLTYNSSSDSASVRVENIAPTFTITGASDRDASGQTAYTGQTYTLTIDVTDPDTDFLEVEIDWGDGSPVEQAAARYENGQLQIVRTHQYRSVGDFDITVTAQDNANFYSPYYVLIDSQNPAYYYRFDDSAGASTITDQTGTLDGNNLGVTLGAAAQNAIFGTAGDFGGNDYVTLGGAQAMGLGSNFTVTAWVNARSVSDDQTVLGTDVEAVNQGLHLIIRSGEAHMGFFSNDLNGTVPVNTNEWYHLTWKFEDGTQSLYVNGELDTSGGGRTPFAGTSTVNIGRWINDRYFNGVIDEVAIFNEALSDAQILQQYNILDTGLPLLSVAVENQRPRLEDVQLSDEVNQNREVTLTGTVVDTDLPEDIFIEVNWADGSSSQRYRLSDYNTVANPYEFSITYQYLTEAPADGWDVEISAVDIQNEIVPGLWGSYYSDTNFDTLEFERIDANALFNWGGGSPEAATLGNDFFSVVWEGQLALPQNATNGLYTFVESTDDGGRIYLDGELIQEVWTIGGSVRYASEQVFLEAGQTYDLRFEFFEQTGGAAAELFWLTPGDGTDVAAAQPIPESYLSVESGRSVIVQQNVRNLPPEVTVSVDASGGEVPYGLVGTYYNGLQFDTPVFSRIDDNVNFNWGSGGPGNGINNDNFTVVWEGQLVLPPEAESGTYYLAENTDDRARIYINGELVLDQWFDEGPARYASDPIQLTAGEAYDIRFEFYENGSGAVAELFWLRPGEGTNPANARPIPDAYFRAPQAADAIATGETVTVTVNATDFDTNSGVVTVDWGDGTQQDVTLNYGANRQGSVQVTHTYQEAGLYDIRVFSSDNSGTYTPYNLTVLGQDPLAYYRFEDANGSDSIRDWAGSFEGTNFDVGTGTTSGLPNLGSAGEFDGNDYVELFNPQSLGLGGNFTVSAWINADALDGDRTILGNDEATFNTGLHLVTRNATPHLGFYSNDTGGSGTLSTGEWYHLAYRFENGTQTIFVNGQQNASTDNHTAFAGTLNALIGRWNSSNYFDGLIDEVAIFDRALSAADIDTQWQAGYLNAAPSVLVQNVEPQLTNVTVTPEIDENDTVTVSGTIVETDLTDALTLTIDWGNGDVQQYDYAAGTTSFSETYQYLDDGSSPGNGTISDEYEISVSIVDDEQIADFATIIDTDFSTAPENGTLYTNNGNSGVTGGELVLTVNQNSQVANYVVSPTLENPRLIQGFDASFDLLIGGGTNPGADGFSFNYGDVPAGTINPAEGGIGTGLAVAFDSYAGNSGFSVRYNGQLVPNGYFPLTDGAIDAELATNTYLPVTISVTAEGRLTLTHDGEVIFEDLEIPGWAPTEDWAFALAARTGGLNDNHRVDNLAITANNATNLTTVVNNVPPQITNVQTDVTSLTEGETVTVTGTFTDPGTQDVHSVTIDWGDGALETFTLPLSQRDFSFTHTYVDDNPSGTGSDEYLIQIAVRDDDQGSPSGVVIDTDFSTVPEPGTLYAATTNTQIDTVNGRLVLTANQNNQNGHYVIDAVSAGRGFEANFDLLIGGGTDTGADGVSFNFGDVPAGFLSPAEAGIGSGLAVTFDTYTSNSGFAVRYNGQIVPGGYFQLTDGDIDGVLATNTFEAVNISVTPDGRLTLVHDGETIFSDLEIPGWNPQPNWDFSVAARTGGFNDNQWVDNLNIRTYDAALTVTVVNDEPEVTNLAVTPNPTAENNAVTLSGTFTDAGLNDTHTVYVDWGDGTGFEQLVLPVGQRDFALVHNYPDDNPTGTIADQYEIRVWVLDDDMLSAPVIETDFSTPPAIGTVLANNSATGIVGGELLLTENTNNQRGTYIIDTAGLGALATFQANFDLFIGNGNSADGLSFNYGPTPAATVGENGYGSGLTVAFDTFNNGGGDFIGLELFYNGQSLATQPVPIGTLSPDTYVPVEISVSPEGLVTVIHNGVTIFNGVSIPDWNPQSDWDFSFGARTGGSTDRHAVDNLSILPTYTPETIVLTVENEAPANLNLQLSSSAIVEGGTVTLNGTFEDASPEDTFEVVIDWGDGSQTDTLQLAAGERSFSLDHQYLENPTVGTEYTITVTITDDDTGSVTETIPVEVLNSVPQIANFEGPTFGVPGQNLTYTVEFTDQSLAGTETYTYMVTWGDGTQETGSIPASNIVVDGSGTTGQFTISHAYTSEAGSPYPISVTVTDSDGATSPAAETEVTIAPFGLAADPWDPNLEALLVGGSTEADIIFVRQQGPIVQLYMNNRYQGSFEPDQRIFIWGQDGNDRIVVSSYFGTPYDAIIDGGAGNDMINTGGGNDLILGGGGLDRIDGGAGNDIAFGGDGRDTVSGGRSGDDLLAGGALNLSLESQALAEIYETWNNVNSDPALSTVEQRVNALRSGVGSAPALDPSTLPEDGDPDVLAGGLGTDWLIRGSSDRGIDAPNGNYFD